MQNKPDRVFESTGSSTAFRRLRINPEPEKSLEPTPEPQLDLSLEMDRFVRGVLGEPFTCIMPVTTLAGFSSARDA